ncbi:MAG: 50S ribosomal protein L11 methyltransferase [bacterium]
MTFTIVFIILVSILLIWHASLIISTLAGAPTVYAKTETIEKAFELVRLQSDQVVLDLGCGNARSLIIASQKFGAKGIGVEVSPFYYLLARLNVLTKGERKNIQIYFGQAQKQARLIEKADVVYMYLFDSLLRKLEPIIFNSATPKTKIVSIAFPLKEHKPVQSEFNPRIFIYQK